MSTNWWEPTVVLPKGYVGRVVIEPDMETQARNAYYEEANVGYKYLQLARCFSLDTKEYVYIDVENLKEYEYDTKANDRLVLPAEMKGVLTSLFNWNGSEGFGDIFTDRHGGVVVLAAGKPGVGKTLTAEVYAHIMQRPLYSIDLTELGTTVDKVEASLSTIFQRVTRWNAVLLLDEADIFLVKRDVDNIERNAIVGTFLKFLDGFDGTLFLTTNRVEVIDPAFASRITARIHYEKLDVSARTKVWRRMVDAAKIEIPTEELAKLAEKTMNGRQIRNVVRLAKMFYRNKPLNAADFTALDKHILKVDETWDAPGKTTTKENV
jgi:SpoVK/Ycf46/Vps4 family AAA+-type ATPase